MSRESHLTSRIVSHLALHETFHPMFHATFHPAPLITCSTPFRATLRVMFHRTIHAPRHMTFSMPFQATFRSTSSTTLRMTICCTVVRKRLVSSIVTWTVGQASRILSNTSRIRSSVIKPFVTPYRPSSYTRKPYTSPPVLSERSWSLRIHVYLGGNLCRMPLFMSS